MNRTRSGEATRTSYSLCPSYLDLAESDSSQPPRGSGALPDCNYRGSFLFIYAHKQLRNTGKAKGNTAEKANITNERLMTTCLLG